MASDGVKTVACFIVKPFEDLTVKSGCIASSLMVLKNHQVPLAFSPYSFSKAVVKFMSNKERTGLAFCLLKFSI